MTTAANARLGQSQELGVPSGSPKCLCCLPGCMSWDLDQKQTARIQIGTLIWGGQHCRWLHSLCHSVAPSLSISMGELLVTPHAVPWLTECNCDCAAGSKPGSSESSQELPMSPQECVPGRLLVTGSPSEPRPPQSTVSM